MRFKIVVDRKNSRHVHWRLFANGALTGKLCSTISEYRVLLAALRSGLLCLEVEDRDAVKLREKIAEGWSITQRIENDRDLQDEHLQGDKP